MMRYLPRFASPLLLVFVWEATSRLGLVNPLLLPAPTRVLADLADLISSGYLWKALQASMVRVVCGFALSVLAGFTIGALMARIALIERMVDPLVELFRPISPLALYPLAILWLGIGDGSKIFVIALAACFPVILNTFAGVRAIDPNMFRVSKSLGATEVETFFGVVLPGSLPGVFTGIRLAWGVSLIVIVAAEMIGATRGIGYMVLEAQQTFRTERVFGSIVVIGAFGFVTDLGFRRLQRLAAPWARRNILEAAP